MTEFLVALDFWCEVNDVKKKDGLTRERLDELKRQHTARQSGKPMPATEWLANGGTW